MADSLFPKDRKKQETQDITLEPAGTRREAMSPSRGPAYHQLALRHLQGTVSRVVLNPSVTIGNSDSHLFNTNLETSNWRTQMYLPETTAL